MPGPNECWFDHRQLRLLKRNSTRENDKGNPAE
jgi:hypothetical protein